jgi:hypothetical protein
LREDSLLQLAFSSEPEACLMCCTSFTWHDLAEIAGYDMNKLDFAVPQSFFDQHVEEFRSGFGYCWYYGGDRPMFGEPVSLSLIRSQAAGKIAAAFYKGVSDKETP